MYRQDEHLTSGLVASRYRACFFDSPQMRPLITHLRSALDHESLLHPEDVGEFGDMLIDQDGRWKEC
jgi:hypothetical protein